MKIHTKIKEKRKELRLSQMEVAKKIGVTFATYNKFENGDTSCLKSGSLFKLFDLLEINILHNEYKEE